LFLSEPGRKQEFLFSGNPTKAATPGYSDPFTGSSAYTSGSGGVPTAKDYGSGSAGFAFDPFTGLQFFSEIKCGNI